MRRKLPVELAKAIAPSPRSVARSGFLTGLSLAAATALAAAVGVVVAREFGRSAVTDGFFAAYGVFVVLSIAASSLRVVVQPPLARAREAGALGGEIAAYALALAVVAVPALLVSTFASEPVGDALTGPLPEEAAHAAAVSLEWMVPAAVLHLYAALGSSALAALDDYGTAALGYALGSAAGLALILLRVGEDGIVAVAWGSAVTGAVPLVAVAVRLAARGAPRTLGGGVARRLGELAGGAVLPLALQALYLVCVRLAADLGVGQVTSFSYAYLIASALVAVTASSLGLVSSVPLTRAGLGGDAAARHVVATSWLALAAVAAGAGAFALAGERIVRGVLGDAYAGDVGGELARLVAGLAPWMAASAGVTLAFPLLFVRGRPRRLPLVAAAALVLHVPLAWTGRELFGIGGVVAALATTTALVLAALLALLPAGTLVLAARGIAAAAITIGALAGLAFGPASLLGAILGAAVGLVVYAVLLLVLRPRGLRQAWGYVRTLH
jgi:O-antigen/teichoic acid export membrane protein